MSADDEGTPGGFGTIAVRGRIRRRFVVIALLAVAVAVYVLVVLLYASSGRTTQISNQSPPSEPDAVVVQLSPSSVNGPGERITMDVKVLADSLIDDDAISMKTDLDVLLTPIEGQQALHLEAGEVVSISSATFIASGAVENWPFDRYEIRMLAAAYTTNDGVKEGLPTYVDLEGYVPGWSFSGYVDESDTVGTLETAQGTVPLHTVVITASRSGSTMAFGFLLLALLVVMPTLVLFVAIRTFTGRRKVEATLTSWMGAMLFATIPLRTFLPGSPPIGSWIDYLIVLWVIVGLITGLVIYVLAWNRWGSPTTGKPPPSP